MVGWISFALRAVVSTAMAATAAAPTKGIEFISFLAAVSDPATFVQTLESSNATKVSERRIPLYARSSSKSKRLGAVIIRSLPGKGLHLFYQPPHGSEAEFTSDIFDSDWGYGPWLHQTISKRSQQWVQLPPRPFSSPVWIEIVNTQPLDTETYRVAAGDVITVDQLNYFVIKADPEHFLVRPEQAADMPCDEKVEPIKEVAPTLLPRTRLFDHDGHSLIKPTYTRGC